ncbi:MAG TPA: hypothetical protein VHY31_09540 [Streptosporangiaceae bacterium]|jgi:hypothetical protein|nr:hypothetical protein [Streptosporangiaceae bacterium]
MGAAAKNTVLITGSSSGWNVMAAPVMVAAGQVALTVLAAATDGTDQLRYLVGNDTRGFIQAWETLPNAEFLAFMRARFLGTP